MNNQLYLKNGNVYCNMEYMPLEVVVDHCNELQRRIEALKKQDRRNWTAEEVLDNELIVSLDRTLDSYPCPAEAMNDLLEWQYSVGEYFGMEKKNAE